MLILYIRIVLLIILVQYAGVWYEVYRHDINETFVTNPNGTMSVWIQDITNSGYASRYGSAVAKDKSKPAVFEMHVNNPSKTISFCVSYSFRSDVLFR